MIKPGTSPCVECLLWLYPPQVTFPACTLANRPRLPEHCIVYTKQVRPTPLPLDLSLSVTHSRPSIGDVEERRAVR